MIQHIHRPRATAYVAAITTAVVVAASGCGSNNEPTPPPAVSTSAAPSPAPAGVDDRDPDQVMLWSANQLYSWRPAQDASAAAGFDRARPLLDPTYIQQVGASAAGLARVTGASWARWAADNATITASSRITGDDHPADTGSKHQRVVEITQRISAPGITEPDRTVIAYMVAARQPGTDQWRVSMISPR